MKEKCLIKGIIINRSRNEIFLDVNWNPWLLKLPMASISSKRIRFEVENQE